MYTADKVIITVPVKILQNDIIKFTPELPADKRKAIADITFWDGCKAFIEFSEEFYPAVTGFELPDESDGHKLYYNAAYGQDTNKHILGLFAVGPISDTYRSKTDSELIDYMLSELDTLFDSKASQHYVKHIFQDWTKEPYINGAYVHYYQNWKTFRTLQKSVDNKLYFAGDAYTDGLDFSSVHTAAKSAIKAVKAIT